MHQNTPLLIAEDDENDVILMQRALGRAGVTNPAVFLRDGQQVIDLLESSVAQKALMLLLDLKMPKVSGFEVLEWKLNRKDLRCLPTVILTSSDQFEDMRRAYELGASSYLVKPTDAEGLERLIDLLRRYWIDANRLPVAK
jgi:CheY-like chemotaxis protein